MGDKILKSLQFPGSTNRYKIPQSDYAQTDSTQPDYIKNKLVGKEVTYSDTLTWDGNTEGLDACKYMEGVMFYRVSDVTPALNDFVDGTKLGGSMGGEIHYQDVDISKICQDKNLILDPTSMSFVICLEDGTPYGDGVMNKGLYFMDMSEYGVFWSSLTIPNYTGFPTTTTKKLTAEYLEPFEVVTAGGDTLTWDGDTSGKTVVDASSVDFGVWYLIDENVNSYDTFANGFTVKYFRNSTYTDVTLSQTDLQGSGNTYFIDVNKAADSVLYLGLLVCSDNLDMMGDGSIVFPKKGLYFTNDESGFISSLTINGYTGFPTTEKKLKGEYLIDTNSIILKSSGGKRFKVTVSDTGTLTATEI